MPLIDREKRIMTSQRTLYFNSHDFDLFKIQFFPINQWNVPSHQNSPPFDPDNVRSKPFDERHTCGNSSVLLLFPLKESSSKG